MGVPSREGCGFTPKLSIKITQKCTAEKQIGGLFYM